MDRPYVTIDTFGASEEDRLALSGLVILPVMASRQIRGWMPEGISQDQLIACATAILPHAGIRINGEEVN